MTDVGPQKRFHCTNPAYNNDEYQVTVEKNGGASVLTPHLKVKTNPTTPESVAQVNELEYLINDAMRKLTSDTIQQNASKELERFHQVLETTQLASPVARVLIEKALVDESEFGDRVRNAFDEVFSDERISPDKGGYSPLREILESPTPTSERTPPSYQPLSADGQGGSPFHTAYSPIPVSLLRDTI